MASTKKLIMLVRMHPCLYNTLDKDYRNSLKKEISWDKISKELKQSRDATKNKWKNLKDGYTKYKKQLKGTLGQKKKYINWCWAPYLEFLDSTIELRSKTSNVDIPDENVSPSESASASNSTHSSHIDMSHENNSQDMSLSSLPCLVMNNKKKADGTDHLFASYAETFKRLKPRTQAFVKLQLAQIFTEAELADLDSEHTVPVMSPTYSFVTTSTLNNDVSTNDPLDSLVGQESKNISVSLVADVKSENNE